MRVGWVSGPYLHLDTSTVFSLAGVFERQWDWTSWVWPWVYRSNAQVRIEWFIFEVHHIRPCTEPTFLDLLFHRWLSDNMGDLHETE